MHDSASSPRNGVPPNSLSPELLDAMAERIVRNLLPKARKKAAVSNAFRQLAMHCCGISAGASFLAKPTGAGLVPSAFAAKDIPSRQPDEKPDTGDGNAPELQYNADTGIFEILDYGSGKTPDDPSSPPPPETPVVLSFRSDLPSSAPGYWTAELTLPGNPSGLVSFRLLFPAKASGILHFCGVPVPVVRGSATVPLATLRERLSTASVAFAPDGAPPSPGSPILTV